MTDAPGRRPPIRRSALPLSRAARLLLLPAFLLSTGTAASSAPEGQQERVLEGRVVRGDGGGPVAEQVVALHRITPDTAFVVDSVPTDADGAFSFPLPTDDDEAVHIATARYDGVLYFGPALHGDVPPDYRIRVYPARPATAADTVVLRARTLVMEPSSEGFRVVDVVEAAGDSAATLTPPPGAGGEGWWSVNLPGGARDVRVLPGTVEAGQVHRDGTTARISALVPPAGQRLVLGYTLPGGEEAALRLARPVERLELYVQGDAEVAGLSEAGDVEMEGRRFRRYRARGLAAGRTIRVEGPRGGTVVPVAVGWGALALGGMLALAAVWSWRRRRAS